MKMQHDVLAPEAGQVSALRLTAGQHLAINDLMFKIIENIENEEVGL